MATRHDASRPFPRIAISSAGTYSCRQGNRVRTASSESGYPAISPNEVPPEAGLCFFRVTSSFTREMERPPEPPFGVPRGAVAGTPDDAIRTSNPILYATKGWVPVSSRTLVSRSPASRYTMYGRPRLYLPISGHGRVTPALGQLIHERLTHIEFAGVVEWALLHNVLFWQNGLSESAQV